MKTEPLNILNYLLFKACWRNLPDGIIFSNPPFRINHTIHLLKFDVKKTFEKQLFSVKIHNEIKAGTKEL